jgi:DeoR/GlpR family transcriptional regulator of sugar metabolism
MDTMKTEAEVGQIALKEERHQYILELLGCEGRVLAAELSSRYRVSEDTIRRDLRELASSGKIQRVPKEVTIVVNPWSLASSGVRNSTM